MPVRRKTAEDDAPDMEDYLPKKKPAARRYVDEEDDDEEDAARASAGDPDEDDEDEAPVKPARKSRRPVEDEDDDEEPVKASRKTRRPAEEDDDEEEEDADDLPPRSSIIQKGWKAARQRMAESSEYTNDFKFTEDDQLVKFLSDDPITYKQHWLDNKSGKKSYVCLEKGCPLCDILGDTPASRYAWPIINLTEETTPVQILSCASRLTGLLGKYNDDAKKGPLSKNFWSLSKSGKGQSTTYAVELVRSRDLGDDWDLDEDKVEAVIAAAKVPDDDAMVHLSSKKELTEIARDLS